MAHMGFVSHGRDQWVTNPDRCLLSFKILCTSSFHLRHEIFNYKRTIDLSNLCPGGRTGGWLQMHRLSSRKNWLKLETSGNLPIILEESMEYTRTNESIETGRCQHVTNRLDFESLGSWPTLYAKKTNFSGTGSKDDEWLERVPGELIFGHIESVKDRSESISNRLHVDISRFWCFHLFKVELLPLKLSVDFLNPPTSSGSYVTNRRFFPDIASNPMNMVLPWILSWYI